MNDLIYIRVLQHDTEDQIRVSASCPTDNLERTAENVIQQYEKDCAWCGGFATACEQYYKRIAIVDAETLQELHSIYRKEAKNG